MTVGIRLPVEKRTLMYSALAVNIDENRKQKVQSLPKATMAPTWDGSLC